MSRVLRLVAAVVLVCACFLLLQIASNRYLDDAGSGGDEPRIVIVGAGVTGLCAARRLEELGYENFVVLEESATAGGLASSVVDERNFTWDMGVHVLFSHYEFFDALLDDAVAPHAWLEHTRKSPAFMRGRMVGYPVQNNLARFPRDEALRILADLDATRADRQRCAELTGKANFADWMHYCFGDELTEAFARPYNFKVWAYRANQMNSAWVGERVAVVDADEVRARFERGVESTAWGPNARFRYPLHGTGAIWRAVQRSLRPDRVHFGATVRGVELAEKRLLLTSGSIGARARVGCLCV